MKDSFVTVKLFDYRTIRMVVFSNALKDDGDFTLEKDGEFFINLKANKTSSMHGLAFYEFKLTKDLELGHVYQVVLPNFGTFALNVDDLPLLDDFDERFAYNGDDLGPVYSKEETRFAIWAPLASTVLLSYHKQGEDEQILMCKRDKCGVYRAIIKGDQEMLIYHYLITNSGVTSSCVDPYAKASTLNSHDSVVVDLNKKNFPSFDDKLPKMNSYCDAIIYEGHVRDLTLSNDTDIVHKGLFKGLCEEGRKTSGGNPAGIDYLKYLGITHLQLLPVLDYSTVDETKPLKSYNWGYDPAHFFVIEGSYASELDNPYSRIHDLQELVSVYHKHGIRIILDVVYNHVYNYQFSIFEKIVPNYFFRRKENGKMSTCSGCGNDFMSEHLMARKMIVDSVVYLLKQFDVDGFRFDLMGLIDVSTLHEIDQKVHSIKKDAILLGEGWDMFASAKNELLGTMYRADILPHYAFFNDRYREIVKGGSGDHLSERGYALLNADYRQGFKYALLGSCIDYTYPHLFKTPAQSVNYIECHDNGTLFDKIQTACAEDDTQEVLERQSFANSLVLLSFGIPFFHAGQEIGLSKKHRFNTYNDNSGVNTFNYALLDSRFNMAKKFAILVNLRKKLPFIREDKAASIAKMVDYKDLTNSGLLMHYSLKNRFEEFDEINVFINPSYDTIYYDQDKYFSPLVSLKDKDATIPMVKNAMITPMSILGLTDKTK